MLLLKKQLKINNREKEVVAVVAATRSQHQLQQSILTKQLQNRKS
jgi:hypothetical protein